MKLRAFLSLTLLITFAFASNSFARKPAVEDFVGVETENYRPTTKGAEVMFNFGNHIKAHQKMVTKGQQSTNNMFSTFVLLGFITLPFFMWFGITYSINSMEVEEDNVVNSNETAYTDQVQSNNVKHLNDYKTDSDVTNKDDDIKKAS